MSKQFVNVISALVGIFSFFLLVVGSAGGIEKGALTIGQGIITCSIGFAICYVAFKIYECTLDD